jgi:hypothetical protein
MADIQYVRVSRALDGAVWGELTVRGVTFAAVENRSVAGYDSLPGHALYNLRMDVKNNDPTVRCLRFVDVPGRAGVGNPFLIHRAWNDNWRGLQGCIAPGMSVGRAGAIERSDHAMNEIFRLLAGEWVKNRASTIYIENHAAGDSWNKDEFIGRRTNKQPT